MGGDTDPSLLVCRCWGAALEDAPPEDAPLRTLTHQNLKRQDTNFQLTLLRDENPREPLEGVSLAMEEQKQLWPEDKLWSFQTCPQVC